MSDNGVLSDRSHPDTRGTLGLFRGDKAPEPASGRGPAEGGPRDDFSKLKRPLWGAPLWPGHIHRFVTTASRYSPGTINVSSPPRFIRVSRSTISA